MPAFTTESLLGPTAGQIILDVCQNDSVTTHTVTDAKCSIGSDRECGIRIQGEGVRPVHCVLLRSHDRTIVRRWAGNTWLNGRPFEDTTLRSGDELRLANVRIRVVRDERIADLNDRKENRTRLREALSDESLWSAKTSETDEETQALSVADLVRRLADAEARVQQLQNLHPTDETDRRDPNLEARIATLEKLLRNVGQTDAVTESESQSELESPSPSDSNDSREQYELSDAHRRIEQLERANTEQADEIERLRAEAESAIERSTTNDRDDEREAVWQAKLDELASEREVEEASNRQYQNALEEKAQELTSTIDEQESEISALRSELSSTQLQLDEARLELAEFVEEFTTFESEIAAHEANANRITELETQMTEESAAWEHEKLQLNEQIETLNEQIAASVQQSDSADELKALTSERDELAEKVATLQEAVDAADDEANSRDEFAQEIDRLTNQCDELSEERDALNEQLAELQRTTEEECSREVEAEEQTSQFETDALIDDADEPDAHFDRTADSSDEETQPTSDSNDLVDSYPDASHSAEGFSDEHVEGITNVASDYADAEDAQVDNPLSHFSLGRDDVDNDGSELGTGTDDEVGLGLEGAPFVTSEHPAPVSTDDDADPSTRRRESIEPSFNNDDDDQDNFDEHEEEQAESRGFADDDDDPNHDFLGQIEDLADVDTATNNKSQSVDWSVIFKDEEAAREFSDSPYSDGEPADSESSEGEASDGEAVNAELDSTEPEGNAPSHGGLTDDGDDGSVHDGVDTFGQTTENGLDECRSETREFLSQLGTQPDFGLTPDSDDDDLFEQTAEESSLSSLIESDQDDRADGGTLDFLSKLGEKPDLGLSETPEPNSILGSMDEEEIDAFGEVENDGAANASMFDEPSESGAEPERESSFDFLSKLGEQPDFGLSDDSPTEEPSGTGDERMDAFLSKLNEASPVQVRDDATDGNPLTEPEGQLDDWGFPIEDAEQDDPAAHEEEDATSPGSSLFLDDGQASDDEFDEALSDDAIADEDDPYASLYEDSTPTAESPADFGNDDGEVSIEEYMNNLLARVGGSGTANSQPQTKSPPPTPASAPSPAATPAIPAAPAVSAPPAPAPTSIPPASQVAAEPMMTSAEFIPRSRAPEADLSAMRELANASTRSAISRAEKSRTGVALLTNVGGSVIPIMVGLSLVAFGLRGYYVLLTFGIICCLVGGFMLNASIKAVRVNRVLSARSKATDQDN